MAAFSTKKKTQLKMLRVNSPNVVAHKWQSKTVITRIKDSQDPDNRKGKKMLLNVKDPYKNEKT